MIRRDLMLFYTVSRVRQSQLYQTRFMRQGGGSLGRPQMGEKCHNHAIYRYSDWFRQLTIWLLSSF